jgi:hypothetical protein
MSGLLGAVQEVRSTGTFRFLDNCITTPEFNALMEL